jgi:orotate phosphoribosyltransferase
MLWRVRGALPAFTGEAKAHGTTSVLSKPGSCEQHCRMTTMHDKRRELLELLQAKSVFFGDFTLASGAKSNVYFDCRLTTFDPKGAWLIGEVMYDILRREESARAVKVNAVGGLTMGADPVAFAIGQAAFRLNSASPVQTFSVRKAAKTHGQTKLVEGNFKKGDTVVVVEDVVTRGESTITAINSVVNEGGKVAFVIVLLDRQEGGRQKIEQMGYNVFPVFTRDEVLAGKSA